MQEKSKGIMSLMMSMLAKFSQGVFYAVMVLVPLGYLPWTADTLEIHKQTIFIVLVVFSVIAWLGTMLVKKHLMIKPSPVFFAVAAFVLTTGISSFFSLAPFQSWVGQAGQEYMSFLTTLSFGLFFLVGIHVLSAIRAQRITLLLSIFSSALIGIASLLLIQGVSFIPTNFIGAPNALAFYLISMSILGMGSIMITSEKGNSLLPSKGVLNVLFKGAVSLTTLAAFYMLMALDYWMLWVAMLLGSGMLLFFTVLRADHFASIQKVFFPIVSVVLSLIFLFFPSGISNPFAVEVSPSYATSWEITKDTWQDTSYFIGSGPGTFAIDYTKFKPVTINQTTLWDVRFDRSGSHVLTVAATGGILAMVAFFFFIVWVLVVGLKQGFQKDDHEAWKLAFVLVAAWLPLVWSLFMYSSNMSLLFLFWLLATWIMSQQKVPLKYWQFNTSPRSGILSTFIFVLLNVGLVTMLFVTVSRYSAEFVFAKALRQGTDISQIDNVIVGLDTAAQMNKNSDVYYRNLSNALLLKAAQEIQSEDLNEDQMIAIISTSISAAQYAANISPNNVLNWSLLGDIYREFSPITDNAELGAIDAYTRAIALAPTNPKYRVSLAKAYLLQVEQLNMLTASEDQEVVDTATTERDIILEQVVTELTTALELKPTYTLARYQLAIAYEQQGEVAESIKSMEQVKLQNSEDVGVALQLGLLYLKQGKTDLAKQELERAVEIAPNFSNARWYLSAVYEQQGDIESAIEQLEYITQFNEENQILDQRLERLRNGEEVADFPEPLEGVEEVMNSEDGVEEEVAIEEQEVADTNETTEIIEE